MPAPTAKARRDRDSKLVRRSRTGSGVGVWGNTHASSFGGRPARPTYVAPPRNAGGRHVVCQPSAASSAGVSRVRGSPLLPRKPTEWISAKQLWSAQSVSETSSNTPLRPANAACSSRPHPTPRPSENSTATAASRRVRDRPPASHRRPVQTRHHRGNLASRPLRGARRKATRAA